MFFCPTGTRRRWISGLFPALRGERSTNSEYRLRRKDTGETLIGKWSFAPIRDPHGTIIGSVVVGRDITKERRTPRAGFGSARPNSAAMHSPPFGRRDGNRCRTS